MQKTIERILNLLEQSGESARKVEVNAGLSNASFQAWRNGRNKPSADAIIKLAKYFGVSTDYLLGLSEERTASTTPSLSSNEQELLHLFNKLSPEDKQRAIGYLTCLCNS